MTNTSTPPTLMVSMGSSSPPSSTQPPGTGGVVVLQVNVNNPSTTSVTLTGLTLSAAGSGDDLTGIDSVQVYVDANNDGVLDAGETLLGTAGYNTNNGEAILVLNQTIGGLSEVNLLVVYNLSATASEGTYQANLNAGGLSATSANGNAGFSGLPVTGAIITVINPTATPTLAATLVPSATPSATPTRTWTPQPTATHTSTPVPTNTSIPTATCTDTLSFTPTSTPTPSVTPTLTHTPSVTETPTATEQPGIDQPIVYPNPSDGTQPVKIHVPGRTGTADVTVQIFTVAFRLVQQQVFDQVLAGTDVSIELKDKSGKPLASGLYYVVVTIDGYKSVGKLMILR
jgi:hypothetical protein